MDVRERPAHRGGWLVAVHLATGLVGNNPGPVLEVRREYAVEAGEVEPGPGHQSRQAGDEVQRLQQHMGRSVAKGVFVLIDHPPAVVHRQTFRGDRPGNSEPHSKEAALLARAVENVFRKLVRFLVGRMSLVRLQEMLRHIYVEETELKLQAETPGKNVPLTRLALNTGLDT